MSVLCILMAAACSTKRSARPVEMAATASATMIDCAAIVRVTLDDARGADLSADLPKGAVFKTAYMSIRYPKDTGEGKVWRDCAPNAATCFGVKLSPIKQLPDLADGVASYSLHATPNYREVNNVRFTGTCEARLNLVYDFPGTGSPLRCKIQRTFVVPGREESKPPIALLAPAPKIPVHFRTWARGTTSEGERPSWQKCDDWRDPTSPAVAGERSPSKDQKNQCGHVGFRVTEFPAANPGDKEPRGWQAVCGNDTDQTTVCRVEVEYIHSEAGR